LSPVLLLDACEFPEFIGGGPEVQFPRLALELDQSGVTGIVTSLDGYLHHGLIVAAAMTWDKPGLRTATDAHGQPRPVNPQIGPAYRPINFDSGRRGRQFKLPNAA
jgi:hypothetical protein